MSYPLRVLPLAIASLLLAAEARAQAVITAIVPEGAPVEGAQVLLDGQPLGTTGGGGTVEVAGLTAGTHALSVLHENFTEMEEPELQLNDGMNDLDLGETWRDLPKVCEWYERVRSQPAYVKTFYKGTRLSEIYDGVDLGAGENLTKVVND